MYKIIISIGFILAAICLVANMILRPLGYTGFANILIIAAVVFAIISIVIIAVISKKSDSNKEK